MNGKTVMLLSQAYTLLDRAEESRKVAGSIIAKAAMDSQDTNVYDLLNNEYVTAAHVFRVLYAEGFSPETPSHLS